MADTWDDDYLNDLEDGHTFADKYLSDRPRPPMEGMHRSEDDPCFDRDAADVNMSPGAQGRSRRIDPGVIEAKFPGVIDRQRSLTDRGTRVSTVSLRITARWRSAASYKSVRDELAITVHQDQWSAEPG